MGKWKICCAVTTLLFIIIVAVMVTLTFTLFKPKKPRIIPQSATLENINLVVFPLIKGNLTLGLQITVDNQNYGGFKFKNSTAYINYRGNLVGEAPLQEDSIPARAKHNVSMTVLILADKLVFDPNFLNDFFSGILNFSSTTMLHGKVEVFNLFKLEASTNTGCNISVLIQTQGITSDCSTKIRL